MGNDIIIWDSENRERTRLKGHSDYVSSIALMQNNILISVGYDSQVIHWKINLKDLQEKGEAEK